MNIALIAAAVIVIAVSIVTSRVALVDETGPQEPGKTVLSEETSEETSQEPPEPEETSTPKPKPTAIAEPTNSPSPTPTIATQNSGSEWTYPGALTDSTDTITDWYRNKIESKGYNVRTSVKTSANDVIRNVISAANGNEEIKIEISKNPGDSEATVVVSF